MSEAAWLAARAWRGIGHLGPRGPVGGPPALVIPGFIANDRSTMELRRALGRGGWRVHGWGMGLNLGVRPDTLERLRALLESIDDPRPVLLVGWSLGGLFARELAREMPQRVRAVVTLGSPFSGSPKANNVWRLYEFVAGHPVDATPIARSGDKPPVPTMALWSRNDGIVAPAAARGEPHESDRQVELDCNHMGFALSQRALARLVAEIADFTGAP